jgi:Beta-propeller repeat
MSSSRHTHMRFAARLSAGLILLSAGAFAASPADLLRSLPLRFEQDAHQRWTVRGSGYAFVFENNAALLRLGDHAVRLRFEGSNVHGRLEASRPMAVRTNYFIGHSYRSAQGFSRLERHGLYPGIDLVYYGDGQRLEYDFNLSPGADPARIRMRFDGAERVSVNGRGEVVLSLGPNSTDQIVQQPPVVYQRRPSGEVVKVKAAYRLAADGSIGVTLGAYNRAQALVIDPAIVYTAYLAGSGADAATAIARDSHGLVYLAGYTYSTDFPLVGDSYNIFNNYLVREVWLMQLDPLASNGNDVIKYVTFFGGELATDLGGMTVDANGVIYFAGLTLTPDLPASNGYASMLTETNGVNDGFVAVLNPSVGGADGLLYCSYYGGTTGTLEIHGIATQGGVFYVTGWTDSMDLPTAGASGQPTGIGGYDAFVAGFDPSQAGTPSLVYSSYLGGSEEDVGRSIAIDAAGKVYVAGLTLSPDLYVSPNAFKPSYSDGGDAFVTEIDPSTGLVVYSTYLGGSDLDVATQILLEPSGNIALAGYTYSTDFPLTAAAAQPAYGGNGDAFIAVLNPAAANPAQALVYSTYFGGSDAEIPYGLARDSSGLYYICGYTLSQDLPVSAGALNPAPAAITLNGFVTVIDPTRSLVYSSYITSDGTQIPYGIVVDEAGRIYVTGYATGDIFSSFPGAFPKYQGPGNYDAFLLVFTVSSSGASSTGPGGVPASRPLRGGVKSLHPLPGLRQR